VRIFAHLSTDSCSLYIDTSGEPLFKRGWREDKGEAPLKETLEMAVMVLLWNWPEHLIKKSFTKDFGTQLITEWNY
jgi:putative N6-adenine-specific DNA methylase